MMESSPPSLLNRVPTNVIHLHRLRILEAARRSAESATNRHIQDCEKIGIEWPNISRRQAARSNGEERRRGVIYKELHFVLRPNNSVGVIGGVVRFPSGKGITRSDPVAPSLLRVNRGLISSSARATIHLRTPDLHDVGFAASRPPNGIDVAAQRPKSWPQALRCRTGSLNTRLENAVLKILNSFRSHAG